jgi:hypothetical protein
MDDPQGNNGNPDEGTKAFILIRIHAPVTPVERPAPRYPFCMIFTPDTILIRQVNPEMAHPGSTIRTRPIVRQCIVLVPVLRPAWRHRENPAGFDPKFFSLSSNTSGRMRCGRV